MKKNHRTFLLFLLLNVVCLQALFSQTLPVIQWQNTIGGSSDDRLYSIVPTSDGGYICGGYSNSNISGDKTEDAFFGICGISYDYWVIKLDATGNIQWQNTIGGTNQDFLFIIRQTSDGGYICGGKSASDISGNKTENCFGDYDYWVVKLDASGNIQWQNNMGGDMGESLNCITQTSDGGYICGGWSASDISGDKTENSMGLSDYWVIKLNAFGAIQWQNTIGGSSSDFLTSIEQTNDGGYICGGTSMSDASGDKTENSMGFTDYWIVKLNAAGSITWQNTIGGSFGDNLSSISQTSDGGFICGGTSFSNISGDKMENRVGYTDYWIIKLNSAGNIVWQNTIGGIDEEVLSSVIPTADNGYICAGYSNSLASGDKTENCLGNYDNWVVKLNASGNILWQNTIGGSDADELLSIQPTIDGGYICGGWSVSDISGDKTENSQDSCDYWVIKLSADNITGFINPDLSQEALNVYPNPVSTILNIEIDFSSSGTFVELKLFDSKGESIRTFYTGNAGRSLNIKSDLWFVPDGIYFLQLKTKEGVSTKKIVKF